MKPTDLMKHENSEEIIPRKEFDGFISAVGSEIELTQVRTISAANKQMLLHYWKMGNFILHNQRSQGWGAKVIDRISQAIREKYPHKKGYSLRNLKYMCQFAKLYPLQTLQELMLADEQMQSPTVKSTLELARRLNDVETMQENLMQITQELSLQIGQESPAQIQSAEDQSNEIGQQLAAQIQSIENKDIIIGQQVAAQFLSVPETMEIIMKQPIVQIENIFLYSPIANTNWASHMELMDAQLPLGIRYWYMKEQVEYGWSRNILDLQIQSGLFQRQLKAGKVNNFTRTLPAPQSDLANYLLKDPYIFDIVNAKEKADERDIEEQLVSHVTKYLLEMGNGFAFVARQKHFQIGQSDFWADLILYNIKLHAYVVIELKATPFEPGYIGQLNFYVNVVNDKLCGEGDNPTIGLILCKGKNEVLARYALDGYLNPIGISDYQLSQAIPENLKSALPSIEEVENEMAARMKIYETSDVS